MRMWLISNPKFRAVVLFTREEENTVQPSAEKGPSGDVVEVRKTSVNLRQLQDVPARENGAGSDSEIPYYVQVVKVQRARATPVLGANNVSDEAPPPWRWEAHKKEILGYKRAGNFLLPHYVLNHRTGAEA